MNVTQVIDGRVIAIVDTEPEQPRPPRSQAAELPVDHAIPLDQRRSVRVVLWPGGGLVIEGDDVRKLNLAQQGAMLDAIDRVGASA